VQNFLVTSLTALLCALGSIAHSQEVADSLALDSTSVSADSISLDSVAIESSLATEEPKESFVTSELKFVNYLISNEQYDDALFVLYKLENGQETATKEQLDSVHYYKGWIHYFKQYFELAVSSFERVDSASSVHSQAMFYLAFCHLYEDRLDDAQNALERVRPGDNEMVSEFKAFQLAGLALLQRDFETYEKHALQLTGKHYLFAAEETELKVNAEKLMKYKKKSAFLAALLSAALPGLGKFYTGYKGTPFGTMFITLPLMAVAIEVAIIAGVVSIPFLIAGGVAGAFYFGNIWGSALSVTAKQREDYAQIDYNVKYDLHVALRRVFE